MKTLVRWFVKRCITKETVKAAIHRMNASFAAKVKAEGKEKVVGVANDAAACIAARLEGFADDGHIDDKELGAINAQDDALVDKYLSDAVVADCIDKLFA